MSAAPGVRLGDITHILSGFAFPSEGFGDSGDLPLIRIRDVVPGRSETWFSGDYDKSYLIVTGDILIGMDGEFNRARWKDGPALLNQRVCKIKSSSNRLDDGYLYWFLPRALKKIEDATPFVTVKHLSAKQLREVVIPLPPVTEQRRIAAILDQADSLRTKRRAALAMLDTLAQSIFVEMFGDPSINHKKWPIRTIADLLESASYGTSEKSLSEGEFPVLRMNNITATGQMDLTNLKYMDLTPDQHPRYLVRTGDVLFNRTNSAELVGKTAIYRGQKPMAYAGYLIRLRVNRVNNPEYLAGFLNSRYAKRMLRGMCKSIIGMANINATEVQSMKIACPPLEVQRAYANQIGALEHVRSTLDSALNAHEALFLSLQYRAFRGEL